MKKDAFVLFASCNSMAILLFQKKGGGSETLYIFTLPKKVEKVGETLYKE